MASHISASFLFLLALSSSFFLTCFSEISRKELRTKGIGLGIVTQLNRTSHSISNRVDPSRVVQLSWLPRVFLYKGFLSDEECDQLISLAKKLDEKSSTDGDDSEDAGAVSEWRLESSKIHELAEDDLVSRIEEKVSAWTFLPQENGKVLKVLRYGVEDTEERLDYFGKRSSDEEREDEIHPLIATVVLYLSNVNRGGQILFPSSEVKDEIRSSCENDGQILRPTKGNALLFFNRHHNTTPDYTSTHSRCPVLDSEMWCATKFFRIKVRGQEKTTHSSDDFLCSDQDDSCPKWAAMGECERNPVYMIGSDDYLGTCRFSCKVC